MKEKEWRLNHLTFGVCVGAIASYAFLSSPYISNESAFMILIFNFLFVSLTFPLNGALTRKLFLLLVGNVIGLLWNLLFSLFAYVGVHYLGEFFNTLYMILSPFVNLVWIVSFWSLSLTALAGSKTHKQKIKGIKFDN